jgi:ABC-type dipeptide/oligopeptide/nickel transport system permease subunit
MNAILAIAVLGIPSIARMMRASVLAEKGKDYVLAARSIGASGLHVSVRHILPNCLPTLLVMASLGAANAILTEGALGFLGLGVQPPNSSWGLLLRRGYNHFTLAPWYIGYTGVMVALVVWALNTLGDGAREALDPLLRGGRE